MVRLMSFVCTLMKKYQLQLMSQNAVRISCFQIHQETLKFPQTSAGTILFCRQGPAAIKDQIIK